MKTQAVWAAVALAATVIVSMTVMLVLHVPVGEIATGFALVGTVLSPLLNLLLYNKMQTVESQTNGVADRRDAMLTDLVNHLKSQTPAPPKESSDGS